VQGPATFTSLTVHNISMTIISSFFYVAKNLTVSSSTLTVNTSILATGCVDMLDTTLKVMTSENSDGQFVFSLTNSSCVTLTNTTILILTANSTCQVSNLQQVQQSIYYSLICIEGTSAFPTLEVVLVTVLPGLCIIVSVILLSINCVRQRIAPFRDRELHNRRMEMANQ